MLKKTGIVCTLVFLLFCGWSLLKEAAPGGALSALFHSEPFEGSQAESTALAAAPEKQTNSSAPTLNGVHNTQAPAHDTRNSLQLALKSISLSQGEGGVELWRLKAESANMHKENGKIVVHQPNLTYFMPEKGETLLVTSVRGIIDQKEQILNFIDNVHILQDDKSITSDILVYNGTAKTMTFPSGGHFKGAGVNGNAPFLVWDIAYKMIKAEGGVSVSFFVSDEPLPVTFDREKQYEK